MRRSINRIVRSAGGCRETGRYRIRRRTHGVSGRVRDRVLERFCKTSYWRFRFETSRSDGGRQNDRFGLLKTDQKKNVQGDRKLRFSFSARCTRIVRFWAFSVSNVHTDQIPYEKGRWESWKRIILIRHSRVQRLGIDSLKVKIELKR